MIIESQRQKYWQCINIKIYRAIVSSQGSASTWSCWCCRRCGCVGCCSWWGCCCWCGCCCGFLVVVMLCCLAFSSNFAFQLLENLQLLFRYCLRLRKNLISENFLWNNINCIIIAPYYLLSPSTRCLAYTLEGGSGFPKRRWVCQVLVSFFLSCVL